MDFMEALRAASQQRNLQVSKPPILPEAAIMRLREEALRFHPDATPKVGDLVTGRPGANLRSDWVGIPMLVLETNPNAAPDFQCAQPGDMRYGSRPQVRVLSIIEDDLCPYWLETWQLEPYTGPGA